MSATPCGTPGATRKRHSFADGDVCSVCDTARSLPKRVRSKSAPALIEPNHGSLVTAPHGWAQTGRVEAALTFIEAADLVRLYEASDLSARPQIAAVLVRGGYLPRARQDDPAPAVTYSYSYTLYTDPAPSTGSSALREMTSGGTVPQQPGSVLHGKDVTDGDAPRGLREDDGLHRDGVQIEGADAAQRPPCPRADAARSQGRDGRGDVLPEQVDARSRGETVDVADLASARARPGAGSTPAESTLPPSEPQQGASAPPCPAAALPPTGPAASLVPPAAGPVPPRVRVPRTVVQGFYDCRIDPGEYEACWNRYGAVSVVLPDGKQAGLKPDEFDWICGKPEPIGMEQHGKVWRPGHGESCESLLLYAPRRPLIDATSALRAADEREQSPVGVAGGATNAREEGDPDRYVLLAVVPGPHGDAPAQGPERSNPEPSFPCRCWAAGSATTCPRCAEVGPGPRVAEAGGDVAARVVLRRFLEDVRRACETAINLIGTEE